MSELTEKIYSLLEGWCDDEIGEAGTSGWYGLIQGKITPEELLDLDPELELDTEDLEYLDANIGYILSVDSQGFQDVMEYEVEVELQQAWDTLLDECQEFEGPQEGDLVTEDHIHVYQGHKLVLETTPDTFNQDVEAYMEAKQYWPTVWFSDDHGGQRHIVLGG